MLDSRINEAKGVARSFNLAADASISHFIDYLSNCLALKRPKSLPRDIVQIVWLTTGLDALGLTIAGKYLVLGLARQFRDSVVIENALDRFSPSTNIVVSCDSRELPLARQPYLLIIPDLGALDLLASAILLLPQPDRIIIGPEVSALFNASMVQITKCVGNLDSGWEIHICTRAYKHEASLRKMAKVIHALKSKSECSINALRSNIYDHLRASEWDAVLVLLEQASPAFAVHVLNHENISQLWQYLPHQFLERVAAMAPSLLGRMPTESVAAPILRACAASRQNVSSGLCWLLVSSGLEDMPALVFETTLIAVEDLIVRDKYLLLEEMLVHVSAQRRSITTKEIIRAFVSAFATAVISGVAVDARFVHALQMVASRFSSDELDRGLRAALSIQLLCHSHVHGDSNWSGTMSIWRVGESVLFFGLSSKNFEQMLRETHYVQSNHHRRVVYWVEPYRFWPELLESCSLLSVSSKLTSAYARFLAGWADLMESEIQRGSIFRRATNIIFRPPIRVLCATVLDKRVARIIRHMREAADINC